MTMSDALVTIPNVEILSTGKYSIANPGEITFTKEDIASVLASQSDPYVKAPRLKIGHESDFGDGEPSFGKVVNMRLTDEGHTLVGDYVGVPKWLAEVMPTAYPSRSIEGAKNATTPDGKEYELLVDAVALLGVVAPGVATLEDLAGLYEEHAPEGLQIAAGERIAAKVGGQNVEPINAAVEVEDVRREYYNQLGDEQMWWWVRAIELDPNALIVDTDDGKGTLYRVPFTTAGDSAEFGDPVEVRIEYVPVGEQVAAAEAAVGSGRPVAVYASREESRPASNQQEDSMEISSEQLTALGLSEGATQEEVDNRLAELAATAAEEATAEETGTTEEPEGTEEESTTPANQEATPALASVDPAALEQMQRDAELGRQARQQQLEDERDSYINAAVKAGKFPKARKEHWAAAWDKDREGTKEAIDSLATGLIPVAEQGQSPSDVTASQEAGYDEAWLSPQERNRISAAKQGLEPSRVTTEGR